MLIESERLRWLTWMYDFRERVVLYRVRCLQKPGVSCNSQADWMNSMCSPPVKQWQNAWEVFTNGVHRVKYV